MYVSYLCVYLIIYVQVYLTMHPHAEKDVGCPALSLLYTLFFEAESLTEPRACSFD